MICGDYDKDGFFYSEDEMEKLKDLTWKVG